MTSIPDSVKKFLEHKISDGFGCSREKIVAGCKDFGRFKHWLGSDETKINQLLDEVEKAGMSAELFAAKEREEGFNPELGWHNHTYIKGDPIEDAKFVVSYTLGVSEEEGHHPAWDDPYGGTVGVVPQSVMDDGNAHYATLGSGTIGRAYIAMTAAATWAMYYPEALSASVNGVTDYDDPLSGVMTRIKEWGGDIDISKPNSSSNSSQKPSNSSSSHNTSGNKAGFYYIQNDTLWLLNGNGSGNLTRTNGTSGGSSSDSSGSSGSSTSSGSFSDAEDKKLWEATEGENPSGGDGLTDHVKHVRAFIMKKFGLTEAHGWRQDDDGTGHGHNSGMAVDFMVGFDTNVDSALGQKIADYFQNNFEALGCYYLIWQQHFYMDVENKYGPANTWNPMEDRGSPTQNHMDHVHVSFAR